MVIRTIEILLEYLAIILCIHKIGKRKLDISISLIIIFIINLITMFLIDKKVLNASCKLFVLGCILIYVRKKIAKSWKVSIGLYVGVLLSVMALQYVIYLLFYILQVPIQTMPLRGVLVNFVICVLVLLWKESFLKILFGKMKEYGREGIIIVLIIICLHLLFMCNKDGIIKIETLLQFLVQLLVLCLAFVLWYSAEMENRHKEREIKMYKLYNQAFEETISTIRMRQHEFQNHINAIKCMKYAIKNKDELLFAQEEYCNKILNECEIGTLLRLKIEPVLVGFLYARITAAEESGVHIEYEIDSINLAGMIENYEIIELLGILCDNAVEALLNQEYKRIILKLKNTETGFLIEIANMSRVYTHAEIEQFCTYGYSTKGNTHGVGLSRVREIIKKVDGILLIQNKIYDNHNYLSFQITIDNK